MSDRNQDNYEEARDLFAYPENYIEWKEKQMRRKIKTKIIK